MGHSADITEIKKEIRRYVAVFVALAALTVITVAISYLELSLPTSVVLALFVATIKGGLVVCYFMHLISERKFIYIVLILTVIFVSGLFLTGILFHQTTQAGVDFVP